MHSAEERDALIDGVLKHGCGKWAVILRDPAFALRLRRFSECKKGNVVLKDLWYWIRTKGWRRERWASIVMTYGKAGAANGVRVLVVCARTEAAALVAR